MIVASIAGRLAFLEGLMSIEAILVERRSLPGERRAQEALS